MFCEGQGLSCWVEASRGVRFILKTGDWKLGGLPGVHPANAKPGRTTSVADKSCASAVRTGWARRHLPTAASERRSLS